MTPEQESALATLTEAVRPIVQAIESRMPTTKDNYGEYLAAITRLTETITRGGPAKDGHYLTAAYALCKAGANRQGVTSALRILGVMQ